MSDQEKKWRKEFKEWFPYGEEHKPFMKEAYLQACKVRKIEMNATLTKIADSISKIPASCSCKDLNHAGHQDNCRWKGLYDAEQIVRGKTK